MCRRITALGRKGPQDDLVEALPVNISLANIISHLQTEEILRIICPELTESRHAFLQSFPPAGPGTDFSFLEMEGGPRLSHPPHDINEVSFISGYLHKGSHSL
jgi:hypothetical protein